MSQEPENEESSQDDALLSAHESGSEPSPSEPPAEEAVAEDRDRRVPRPDGHEDLSRAPARTAESTVPDHDGLNQPRLTSADTEAVDPQTDHIAQVVLQRLEAHLHLPMQIPDGRALAELREQDPKAHAMWLRQVEKQMRHQRFMESAAFKMPLRVMRSAHVAALIALVAMTALTAYALFLDEPWFATIFGVIDLVAILGVFTGAGKAGSNESEDDQ